MNAMHVSDNLVEAIDPVELAAYQITECVSSFREALERATSMNRALEIRQLVNDAIQELTSVENDALQAAGRLPSQ